MKALINRKTLTRLVAMDLLGEDLSGFHFDLVKEATTEALASAFLRCQSRPLPAYIDRYRRLRQVEACFKKETPADGKVPNDLVVAALRQFDEVEHINERTNRRWHKSRPAWDDEIWQRARSIVHYFFPPVVSIEGEMWPLCDFGPGATFHKALSSEHILAKLEHFSVTAKCKNLALSVLKEYFPRLWDHSNVARFEVCGGNRLAFVPKDKDKCRTIAIEPSLNMFLQKGIGEWMARRLRKRFGIDIRDQSRNGEGARLGSLNQSLSTIDMSDASSRIPTELVRWLLPPDWFVLLDTCRSESGLIAGEWHDYEMFSSQGNAFTFPLETLIFYAICSAVHGYLGIRTQPLVYGDDMIVDTRAFDMVVRYLHDSGGQVNILKSFKYGYFRESCGKDYIFGVEVRPIYYKADAVCFSDVATLHNLLVEKWGFDALPRTLKYLESLVPKDKRLYGPRSMWSHTVGTLWNTKSREYGKYFWLRDPTVMRWQYEPSSFDSFCYAKVWDVKPMPPKCLNDAHELSLYSAFLHGGERTLMSSRLVRRITRRVKIYMSCVVR